ncbi:MAG: type IV pilus modification PilV family protein [Planctomycetota bacterium]|jgi:prepilin-type N-terminal cleavage/methylation domain-containing protein
MTSLKYNKSKCTCGVSLIEVMIATVILAVAIIGASGYRYYATVDARKSADKVTAARIALMLCESWRGAKGSLTFDPVVHFTPQLKVVQIEGPSETGGFGASSWESALLGAYTVQLNGVSYIAVLRWKDVNTKLRTLSIVVRWDQQHSDYQGDKTCYQGGETLSSPETNYSTFATNKSFRLTTYIPI